ANDTTNVLYASKNDSSSDWTESKVVLCDDGSLRMYYSRNALGCMQYTVSTDDGITWSGLYQVPQMQCASSSFSLIKDDSPLAGDTDYYLVWVNNEPVYLGSSFSRTRLSLAKSTDGKNWTYLCDIERMTPEVYSSDLTMTSPIFQIVDPSIYVNDDYVFVSYGCSGNSGTSFHNALRLRIARIEKSALTPKSWNASNVSNMLFTQSLTLTAAPKTAFSLNETFTYSGGTVRITRLDGTVKDIDTSRMYVETKPDMTAAGQKTVVLYDMNGFSVSYSINVS
ncbi:MAG: exo-alpha-sialidase, partial [Clostridia bacterium]|nr:exo-alpha-sialidase [Clostridia bacterium]